MYSLKFKQIFDIKKAKGIINNMEFMLYFITFLFITWLISFFSLETSATAIFNYGYNYFLIYFKNASLTLTHGYNILIT